MSIFLVLVPVLGVVFVIIADTFINFVCVWAYNQSFAQMLPLVGRSLESTPRSNITQQCHNTCQYFYPDNYNKKCKHEYTIVEIKDDEEDTTWVLS